MVFLWVGGGGVVWRPLPHAFLIGLVVVWCGVSLRSLSAASVRIELLAATMKLFFKRPPECQKMLGRLLQQAIADTSNVDVRDRALLYYRLLQLDVHEAARVVHGVKVIVDAFVDADDADVKERIFDEFNKLSVLYKMPGERFINLNMRVAAADPADAAGDDTGDGSESLVAADSDAPAAPAAAAAAVETVDFLDTPSFSAPAAKPAGAATAAPAKAAASQDFDLLDLMSGGPSPAPAPAAPSLQLVPRPVVDPPFFQSRWMALPLGATSQLTLQV